MNVLALASRPVLSVMILFVPFSFVAAPAAAQVTPTQPGVAITMDAGFDFASVDVSFGVDIFDPVDQSFESYSFMAPVFGGLRSGETASPAFNALLAANPNIRTGLSYNPAQVSEFDGDNRFDGRVITRYRDPVSGQLENLVSNTSLITLLVEGTNSVLGDSVNGVGFSFDSGFEEFGTFNGEFIETSFFGVDFENSISFDSGQQAQSFRQVFGQAVTSELSANIFLEGQLPSFYSAAFSAVSFVDSEGTMLTSENGGFTLPIADLDKIDRGSASFTFVGSPDFFGQSDYILNDGREVSFFVGDVELHAQYTLNSAFATTTAQSVIDQFVLNGDLPLEDVPGSFDLPDAVGSPRTEDPVLIGDQEFTLDDMFLFNEVSLSDRVVYDPPVAVGYEYELTGVDAGEGFADILLPTVLGDSEFMISVFDPSLNEYLMPQLLLAGDTFDFSGFGFDVTRFSVLGIDVAAMLDPNNELAFPALIGFNGNGVGTLSQTPLTVDVAVVPEPGSWFLLSAVVGVSMTYRRRKE